MSATGEAVTSCFPPLAEGQSGRLGRRCYSRWTPHRPTAPHGLSARVPRDSPEERNIKSPSAVCLPPLAEGQPGRLGRRLYNRLTPHHPATPRGLSARVPRDSPEVVQFSAGVFAWFFGGTLQLVEPKQVLGEDHKSSFAGCSALPSTVKTINPTIALRIREA